MGIAFAVLGPIVIGGFLIGAFIGAILAAMMLIEAVYNAYKK